MKIKGDRLCHICGTHYKEELGHKVYDCWGIIYQQLLRANRQVKDLEYKLKQAQAKIPEGDLCAKCSEAPYCKFWLDLLQAENRKTARYFHSEQVSTMRIVYACRDYSPTTGTQSRRRDKLIIGLGGQKLWKYLQEEGIKC